MEESPLTLFRVTQTVDGEWKAMIAEGHIEDNEAHTFGSYGWCRLKGLPSFYRNVLLQHFPHHVAITPDHVGNILYEVFGKYLGFDIYYPGQIRSGEYLPELPF
jgi:L-fucose isomerase-like protein